MLESANKASVKPASQWRGNDARIAESESAGYSILIGPVGDVGEATARSRPLASPVPLRPTPQAPAEKAGADGESLFYQRRFNEAVAQFQVAVRLAPGNPLFHYRLAYSAWRANQLSLVARHAHAAIDLDSNFSAAQDLLGQWYLYTAQYDLALKHSASAIALAPGNTDAVLSRAFVLAGSGDAAAAWELLRPLMLSGPHAERSTILYLQIATRIQREREAAEWALRHLAHSVYPPPERPQLLFALSGLLDRLGRYDEAFAQAQAARRLLHVPYDPKDHERAIARRIEFFTAARMRSLPRATYGSRRPVFIVGMPRSGTSLVEQILASHPQVHGAGELDDLLEIAAKAGDARPSGASYPQSLAALDQSSLDELAGQYIARIDSLNSGAMYVTDKMPLNYLELGLIELLFPGCRIIHCVRDPMDTCLSCYMTDIAAGVTFCRDQGTLAAYYRQYARLMAHWRQVLSVPMLEVRYEEVVRDTEGQTRRMLGYLNLPWDAACTRFHESKRPVATASREQVRRPVYDSSIGRWKHYQTHLGPLSAALNALPLS